VRRTAPTASPALDRPVPGSPARRCGPVSGAYQEQGLQLVRVSPARRLPRGVWRLRRRGGVRGVLPEAAKAGLLPICEFPVGCCRPRATTSTPLPAISASCWPVSGAQW